ncbi:MAG: response regulator [Magnetococcales bacterium]|nr:response regulator [Magnetococcales bacterium]
MRTVLIIDDDNDFRLSLAKMLAKSGFAVQDAANGEAALALVAKNHFDIILLDLLMPDQDGLELLVRLRKVDPVSKIMMVTAFATVENAVTAIKKGASDYIAKPFRIENLVTALHRIMEEAKFEAEIKIRDLDHALQAVANPIRREIVQLLGAGTPKRVTEMTRAFNLRDHTKLMFHLKFLKDAGIVQQSSNKAYFLTDAGTELLKGLGDLRDRLQTMPGG